MQLISIFLLGLVFGLGLILSGMTDPGKVIGFLDLGGSWDPSLGLVMGGAVIVSFIAFRMARTRGASLLGKPLKLPASTTIDPRLVFGSLAFGAGWGLAGFCPGPAIVSLGSGQAKAAIFVIAMLAGMLVYEVINRRLNTSRDPDRVGKNTSVVRQTND
ncbi:YeeE/YedE family protein [Alcaligenaceae bacterium CGII-47]|nr:YeeE/YedE family protein [Alcaligenaceae bacterium CGII-47]